MLGVTTDQVLGVLQEKILTIKYDLETREAIRDFIKENTEEGYFF